MVFLGRFCYCLDFVGYLWLFIAFCHHQGYLWYFIVLDDPVMAFNGPRQTFVMLSEPYHGPSWFLVDLHGRSWTCIDHNIVCGPFNCSWSFDVICGLLWSYVILHDLLWSILTLCGHSWIFMDLHGPSQFERVLCGP